MNFSCKLNKPYDNNWGRLDSNGTWNGMMKMLQDQEVDFAPASFTMTFERSQAISFGFPFRNVEFVLAIQTPINSLNYLAYLEPFSFWTWICVVLSVMICPFLLYLARHFSTQNVRKLDTNKSLNPWIFSISVFVSRTPSFWPMETSQQFASFSLLFFGMIGNNQAP